MRILHVISSVDPAGGGPIECIRQMSAQWALLGHHSEIASLDDPAAGFVRSCPLTVHALGPGISAYQYAPRFTDWMREAAPDFNVVLVHGLWQYHSFAVWRALRDRPVGYFVFPHGMLDPWFRRRYPLKHIKKWAFWPWSDYRVLRDAKCVLFTCDEERVLAQRSFWLYRARERIAPLGTSDGPSNGSALRDMFLNAYPHLRNRRIVLFLGRVHPKKGCDSLIRAFASAADSDPSLSLVFVGPVHPAWRKKLELLARQLSVFDRITWTGMLQGEMKWAALHASEIFILPSHQENFGIAVVEALASGTPVLLSNKVNIWREIVADGAGFVDDDTDQGTTHLLERWLALAPEERSAMCERALASFHRRFRSEVAASHLIDILSKESDAALE